MKTGLTPRSNNTAPTRQNDYMNKLVKERSITPNKRVFKKSERKPVPEPETYEPSVSIS